MSSDSHRFWEHPTFQMCRFQLLLLSDRKGGDTLTLKKSEELQTNSPSQFYVLHPTEHGTFLLLHNAYGPVLSAYLCISRSRKNSSSIQVRAMPALIRAWRWGMVKEMLKKRLSTESLHSARIVWNMLLHFHMFVEVTDPVLSVQFDTPGNVLIYKLKVLVIFYWFFIYTYSIPPLWLPKIPRFIHISFLVGKGEEWHVFSI